MRIRNLSRRQSMTETIILVAVVGIGVVAVVMALPGGISLLYQASQGVMAAPL